VVDVAERNTENLTTRFFVVLVLITVIFTVFSIVVVGSLVNNFYVGSYYTISALFDAVGVGPSAAVVGSLATFSPQFDEVVLVSIVDGLIKTVIIGFVIAALIGFISSIDITSRITALSRISWKGHVIICGYSGLAERIVMDLASKKTPFVIIDRDPAKTDEVRSAGFTALHEDFTTDTALRNASINTASAIMFLTEDDYDNLLGVVTARHLNDKIRIIARAKDSGTITKIHRAGAELCVVPEVLAGIELGDAIISKGRL
jgi:hypothetical protein